VHVKFKATELFTNKYGISKIYMGKKEKELYDKWKNHGFRKEMDKIFLQEGCSRQDLDEAAKSNPILVYAANQDFDTIPVVDGDKLVFGDITITAVEMPGHTPNHICYYLEKEKIMFLGDHILFDITPNITIWPGIKNSLSEYLTSLHRLLTYDIEIAYPSHRGLCYKTLQQRVDEITEHHSIRLNEILDVVRENPGCSGYEIASKLSWSLHGESFESAPKRQIWFAIGETMAHIEYLIEIGKLYRGKKMVNGNPVHTYYI
ncbi:MAG: MBL fold metallo-hydrolase, partial [Eubacteriales bacterium]|nr:MBL fold metallo-hydrolase [Eubacteriales bacterium]